MSEKKLALAEMEATMLAREPEEQEERTLEVIGTEILTIRRQVMAINTCAAIETGRLLTEAKEKAGHGEWGPWLEKMNFSPSTAQNLMKIYRELGADQQSLFGGVAKTQSIGNLPYTKALKLLLILDEEERDRFVEEHDVAAMSNRELEQAIRERDMAVKRMEGAQKELQETRDSELRAMKAADALEKKLETVKKERQEQKAVITRIQEKTSERIDDLCRELNAAKDEAKQSGRLAAELERAKRELDELKSRPIEVAVEKVVDEEAVEKARAEAVASMQEKLSKAEKALAEAETARAAAEASRDENEEIIRQLNQQLSTTSPAKAEFSRLYKKWQEDFYDLLDALGEVEKEDPETADAFRGSITEAVDNMRQQEA